MRTTVTLDDDVAALIEAERARTGESFRSAVNRLLRRGARPGPPPEPSSLPTLPGRPLLDVSDVSALLAAAPTSKPARTRFPAFCRSLWQVAAQVCLTTAVSASFETDGARGGRGA